MFAQSRQPEDRVFLLSGKSQGSPVKPFPFFNSGNQDDGIPQYGNAWIFKLNGNGGITWQKSYGGNGCLIYSIEQTSDGGYITGGRTPPGTRSGRLLHP